MAGFTPKGDFILKSGNAKSRGNGPVNTLARQFRFKDSIVELSVSINAPAEIENVVVSWKPEPPKLTAATKKELDFKKGELLVELRRLRKTRAQRKAELLS